MRFCITEYALERFVPENPSDCSERMAGNQRAGSRSGALALRNAVEGELGRR